MHDQLTSCNIIITESDLPLLLYKQSAHQELVQPFPITTQLVLLLRFIF